MGLKEILINIILPISITLACFVGVALYFSIKIRLNQIKFKKIQDEIHELNNLPFNRSMNKLDGLSKYNKNICKNYEAWKIKYENFITNKKEPLEKKLTDIKNLEETQKWRAFVKAIKTLAQDLTTYEKATLNIFNEIETFTSKELKLRIEASELKKVYANLKAQVNKKFLGYDEVITNINEIESNLATLLSRFEEAVMHGEYDQAKIILRRTADGIKVYATLVQTIPKIFFVSEKIIPLAITRIEKKLTNFKKVSSFIDNTRFNFLKISSERCAKKLKEFAIDLQYKKAKNLMKQSLLDISKFEHVLDHQIKAYEKLQYLIPLFEEAFENIQYAQQSLNRVIYSHQRYAQLSSKTIQLMTASTKKWIEIERMYSIILSETTKEKITCSAFDVLESILYLSNSLCKEAKNIDKKALIANQIKNKDVHNKELKKIRNQLATIKLNSHLSNWAEALNKNNVSLEKLTNISIELEEQLQRPRFNEDKVNALFSELKSNLNQISILAKEHEWNSERVEAALGLANKHRRLSPEYEIKLSQAESWIASNNHEKAREIIEYVLNDVDVNILKKLDWDNEIRSI